MSYRVEQDFVMALPPAALVSARTANGTIASDD